MLTLEGRTVTLRTMRVDDAQALVQAATDGALWTLPYTVVPSIDTVDAYIATALAGAATGTVIPLVVVLRQTGAVIGSTRFWKINPEHRKLEIGSTWYSAAWQRTAVNTEAKFLLLGHAFEALRCVRVQFTTDVLNERSQQAIARLGAVREGIVRNERIMPDGRLRSSVRYSLIADEWPAVRARLAARLATPA